MRGDRAFYSFSSVDDKRLACTGRPLSSLLARSEVHSNTIPMIHTARSTTTTAAADSPCHQIKLSEA